MPKASIPKSLRARDFMQTDLMTVTPETRLLDVQRMFAEEEIHGAPVVSENGVVCGVVSTLDLARAGRDTERSTAGSVAYFREDRMPTALMDDEVENGYDKLTVGDVMTRELVTVSPETPVAEIARTMRNQRIHRVLVLDGRELVGVVTSFDLLRAFT